MFKLNRKQQKYVKATEEVKNLKEQILDERKEHNDYNLELKNKIVELKSIHAQELARKEAIQTENLIALENKYKSDISYLTLANEDLKITKKNFMENKEKYRECIEKQLHMEQEISKLKQETLNAGQIVKDLKDQLSQERRRNTELMDKLVEANTINSETAKEFLGTFTGNSKVKMELEKAKATIEKLENEHEKATKEWKSILGGFSKSRSYRGW